MTGWFQRRRPWVMALTGLVLLGLSAVWAWPAPDPDRLWEQARSDFEAKRWDQAEARLDRLARLRQPTPRDWMLRAQLAIQRDQIDKALEALEPIPDADPMGPIARLQTGQLELRRNRARAAEAALHRALDLDPELLQARLVLAYLYSLQLRRRDLQTQYQAALERAPLTFDQVLVWSQSLCDMWKAEVTIEVERFVRADPEDRDSRLAWAEGLRQLARFDEAEAVLAPLAVSDPDARAARARLMLDRGDLTAAETLLAEGPADHPALARSRGRLALLRGDGPAAVEHYRRAQASDPEDRETLAGLGRALRSAGDPAAAQPFLKTVHALDALHDRLDRAGRSEARVDPDRLVELGRLCESLGQPHLARAWYTLVITRDPLHSEAQQGLSRVSHPSPTAHR